MPSASGTQALPVAPRKTPVGVGFSREARGVDVGRAARPMTVRRSQCDQNFTTVALEMAARAGSNI
jgi:hypothetical protein